MTKPEQSTAGLPSFRKPPVNEVVLGMQFAAPLFGVVHVGAFYQRIRNDYPKVQQVPPLPLSFETFAPLPTVAPIMVPVVPPFPRQWFISDDDEHLLQLQADHLFVNWRKRDEGRPYPRYSEVRSRFITAVEAFGAVMREDAIGAFVPNQCEITYINLIALSHNDDWGRPGVWVRLWHDEQPATEGVQFTTRNLLAGPNGQPFARLTTTMEAAMVNDVPMFQLSLAVKGRPPTEDAQGVLTFLDAGRKAIVIRFAEITTAEAQAKWEREE